MGKAGASLPCRSLHSEVTAINKQRFLPELGKLLTFMVEEDRQTALAMYGRLFDDAVDEQQLMDLLVSPTRQAVVIARTYDARERKQQLESPNAEEIGTPGFVLAIDKIYQQVAPSHEEKWEAPEETREEREVNQFSLFEDDAHPIDDDEYVPFQIEAESVPIEEPVDQLPLEAQTPVQEESLPHAAKAEEIGAALAEETEPQPFVPAEEGTPEGAVPSAEALAEELPAEESPAEESPAEAVPAEELPAEEVPAEERAAADEAEEFRAFDLSIKEPEEAPPAEKQPEQMSFFPQDFDPKTARPQVSAADYELDYLPETKLKPKVFLLILFTILAIPVALVGTALLLIPTFLALVLAVAVVVLGSATLVAAFSGFPKLADLLIVIGISVIVLAIGLLLLWLFVWFIGGAIGGMIRGLIDLGRKWCYEEVPV